LDRPLSFLGVFMLIKIGNGHFCLFSGKCNGDRSSDPAVPPVMIATLPVSFPLPGRYALSAFGRGVISDSRPGCRVWCWRGRCCSDMHRDEGWGRDLESN
jgi:hypothetical protein